MMIITENQRSLMALRRVWQDVAGDAATGRSGEDYTRISLSLYIYIVYGEKIGGSLARSARIDYNRLRPEAT